MNDVVEKPELAASNYRTRSFEKGRDNSSDLIEALGG
jgi:hypothetical protein